MIDEEKMEQLIQQFQRIFTLPVTSLTFRELHSAISTALNGDNLAIQSFMDALLTNSFNYPDDPRMEDFFKDFSVPFKVAKQIHDNGEVLSMLSTDIGTQGESLVFQVRSRRIDGGEFKFITDANGFLQVAEHIISRLSSTKSTLTGKGAISGLRTRLEALENQIRELVQ
jgi:hypothetical protein